jgi:dCTP deaminase
MGWLTGNQIIKEVRNSKITILPFDILQVNPNSYDYRLGPIIRQIIPNSFRNGIPCIDPCKATKFIEIPIPSDGLLLLPGKAYLGHTLETFGSNYFASLVTGKSSVGRLFINNHQCAGLIDQGFLGFITLEITCQLPTIVYEGMRLGQIFWFETKGKPRLYQGKYQSNNAAQPSKIFLDIEK